MKTVHQIRYENMITVANYFRTRRDFAFAANITPQQVSQLINQPAVHKIGSTIAKRIEKGAGRPEGWLPPSLQSRVDNIASWTERYGRVGPIASIFVD